jgi:hypothetical protein
MFIGNHTSPLAVGVNRILRPVASGLFLACAPFVFCQTPSPVPTHHEALITAHAKGTFEVSFAPGGKTPDETISRLDSAKKFHGDLEGTSKGEMLSTGNPAAGNAAYVAIERVTGTLSGRTGTFALVHIATITQGSPRMAVTVVPGSGTGQLSGILGTFNIITAEGGHSYTFDYTLP